jgi:hypothetical protein
MARACVSYLRARARHAGGDLRRVTYEQWAKMRRTVAFPFSGRVHNALQLASALTKDGDIRQQQCQVWLFFSNLLAEDLVGPQRLPYAYDLAADSGLDASVIRAWVQSALQFARIHRGQQCELSDLDPRIDLLRMDWHPIRRLQLDTRQTYSEIHQGYRFWSTLTREHFLSDGGTFSRAEQTLQSPLGQRYLPWFDSRRFFRPDPHSGFVQAAERLGIPLVTGISGVGMHTFQFARALGIRDAVGVRLVALAYLLPIEQHSYYEVAVSEQEHAPERPERFSYRHCAPLDWGDVQARCGEMPAF